MRSPKNTAKKQILPEAHGAINIYVIFINMMDGYQWIHQIYSTIFILWSASLKYLWLELVLEKHTVQI